MLKVGIYESNSIRATFKLPPYIESAIRDVDDKGLKSGREPTLTRYLALIKLCDLSLISEVKRFCNSLLKRKIAWRRYKFNELINGVRGNVFPAGERVDTFITVDDHHAILLNKNPSFFYFHLGLSLILT